MARIHPPMSKAIVDIDDSLLERYTAQGWTAVADKEPEAPKRRGRPPKNESE